VNPYTLPELMKMKDGRTVKSIADWETIRRHEIVRDYETTVFGKTPDKPLRPESANVIETDDKAFNGLATRKQIEIVFSKENKSLPVNVLVYLPNGVVNPPLFVGYNYFGNHTIGDDPNIIVTKSWVGNTEPFGVDHRATEASRGARNHRWPVKKMLENGFALATVYYGEIDPDYDDFKNGIHPFYYHQGQHEPAKGEWGAIGAWAWGYSRILDYLLTDADTNHSAYLLFGHSRLGKAALWAGALDQRFDMVFSNDSGCGGAALFRRKYGETVEVINRQFPHWFTSTFKDYNDREEDLPVDQHMLIALMAPRPVYVASAEDDRWADPKGEYLAAHFAAPVYELYGKPGLKDSNPPAVSTPVHQQVGYHMRPGKHDVTDYDWEQFMIFARRHLGGR
jgi:hypothetical protein